MGTYDRPVCGSDVIARAQAAGVPADVLARVRAIIDPASEVARLEDLAREIGPERIGLSPGAWVHIFSPLFGEFE
jgi:hypothetical protein